MRLINLYSGCSLLIMAALSCCLVFSPGGASAQSASKAPVPVVGPDAIQLFNGRNLDGWQIYGTERWFVDTDGTLVCESGPEKQYGYLGTTAHYQNFVLSVEFKQERDGNSGVFFHSMIKGTRISGWQAEIAPPGLHTGGIYESYGRGWLIVPDSTKEKVLRMGQWNTLVVRVNGDMVDTWLNGTHMIHLQDAKIGSVTGQIALQIHQGGGIRVRWKNIELKKL